MARQTSWQTAATGPVQQDHHNFEPYICPDVALCHGLSLQWINLVIMSVTSLLANQPVALESECACEQCQSAAVTSPVNPRFSFLPRVSRRQLIDFFAIAIVRLELTSLQTQTGCKLKPFANSNRLQTQTVCKLKP